MENDYPNKINNTLSKVRIGTNNLTDPSFNFKLNTNGSYGVINTLINLNNSSAPGAGG